MSPDFSQLDFQILDLSQLNPSELAFCRSFSRRVIGQPGALQAALAAYNAYKNPLRDKTRPIGIYYLVGPSRTGKSLTAEVLAEIFHGNPKALTRIQASDYEEKHQILDIKGAPPSYIGYRDRQDRANRLDDDEDDTSSIVSTHNLVRARRGSEEPVNIVVIEEFEKSSYDFYKLWMGVFDKGTLKLANGETVDFTNTIFILTSNLATDELERMAAPAVGFGREVPTLTEEDVRVTVQKAMKLRYRREFRNRLDAVVIFRPLTVADMSNIVQAEIELLKERIFDQLPASEQFALHVDQSAQDFLLHRCQNEIAELKRIMSSELIMPLGRLLAGSDGRLNGGDLIKVSCQAGSARLAFSIAAGGASAIADFKPKENSGSATQRRPNPDSGGGDRQRSNARRGDGSGFFIDRDDDWLD